MEEGGKPQAFQTKFVDDELQTTSDELASCNFLGEEALAEGRRLTTRTPPPTFCFSWSAFEESVSLSRSLSDTL